MEEIYRSFSGKLNVDQRTGFIVYESDTMYEVEGLSVHHEIQDIRFRFPKSEVDSIDWATFDYGEKFCSIWDGRESGQVFYRRKWRTPQTLIEKFEDYNWASRI